MSFWQERLQTPAIAGEMSRGRPACHQTIQGSYDHRHLQATIEGNEVTRVVAMTKDVDAGIIRDRVLQRDQIANSSSVMSSGR